MSENKQNQEKISVLISQEEIYARIKELGKLISEEYQESNYIKIVSLLKGSFIFAADLIRAIELPVKIDFMEVSSYGNNTVSSGNVQVTKDLRDDIQGEDVLIVEDIIDSGGTLQHIINLLLTRSPKSLNVVTLLAKREKFTLNYPIRYSGFDIQDEFVVGYGLDYAEFYRNLDYVGVVDSSHS